MIAALALLAAAAQSGDMPNGAGTNSAGPSAAGGDAVLGRWMTTTRHGIVEVSRCSSSICGHLVESDGLRADPKLRDVHNEQAELRQRPLMGLLMLDGFHWTGDAWAGGWIYNGENGGTYHATVRMADATHLAVKGCIVWPLCQSQTGVRVR